MSMPRDIISWENSRANVTFVFNMAGTGETNPNLLVILSTVIGCFVIQFVAITGCLGNFLTLIILSTDRLKETSNILLLSLSASDLFYLVNLSVHKLINLITLFDPITAHTYRAYILCYVRMPRRVAALISLSHIVAISCERLVAVFYPLNVCHMITREKTVTALICIYSGWIILLLPWSYFYLKVDLTFNSIFNKSLPTVMLTKWSKENRHILDMLDFMVINTFTASFPVIVAANCCAILYKLQSASKRRLSMTSRKPSNSGKDLKVSRMLLTLCGIFCLSNFPCGVIYIIFFVNTSMTPPLTSLLSEIEELCLAINSAANFFVYIVMSAKFYKSVVNIVTCRRIRQDRVKSVLLS